MDLRGEEERYLLEADLPGANPDSIEVSVEGQWLSVRAAPSTDPVREK